MSTLNSVSQAFRTEDRASPGATVGAVTVILRLEALLVLVCAVVFYRALGGGWLMFGLLFLVPDLSMLGYLINRSLGAACYNAGHSYLSPGLLALVGLGLCSPIPYSLALIWVSHIGFDRLLGYGLKYPTGFGDTHLGLKGRRS